MPEFLYELHTHEKSVSACGRFSPDELAGLYADLGYAGLCVTDHWFNGNTTIPADLSWTERVDAFARGWEAVKNAGDRRGLDVFFGFEYSYKGTDFLIFDLDAAWMKKNPDIISMSTTDFLTKARGRRFCHSGASVQGRVLYRSYPAFSALRRRGRGAQHVRQHEGSAV